MAIPLGGNSNMNVNAPGVSTRFAILPAGNYSLEIAEMGLSFSSITTYPSTAFWIVQLLYTLAAVDTVFWQRAFILTSTTSWGNSSVVYHQIAWPSSLILPRGAALNGIVNPFSSLPAGSGVSNSLTLYGELLP